MRTTVGGPFATEIYPIDDGYLAIEQAFDIVVLPALDELLMVTRELQPHDDNPAQWQEPIRG